VKKIFASVLIAYICLSCGAKRQLPPADAEDEFERATHYYENENYDMAIQAYERILFYHPTSEYVDDAQCGLAVAYFEKKEYEQAITEFDYLIRNFPASAFLEQAYIYRARAYLLKAPHYSKDATELENALRLLDKFLTQFPNSQHTNEVRQLILETRNHLATKELENGKLYIRIGEEDAALLYFKYVMTTYPETDAGAESKYLAASLYEDRLQHEQALELYKELLENEKWGQKAQSSIEKIEKQEAKQVSEEHTEEVEKGEEETEE